MLPNQSVRHNNELQGWRTKRILAQLNQHMHLYGYQLIELPIIDAADLFLVRAGDQIINSLFTFERQGKQLALRPEFTASASDYFTKTEGDSIARWQFAGSVFEDKSHEFSANFEQLGIGAELIGLNGSLAEAEIIAMSASGLDKLGLQNTRITIGHVGLIREILKQFDLDVRTQRFLLHQISALNDPAKGSVWVLNQFDDQFSLSSHNDTNAANTNFNTNFGSGLITVNSASLLTMGGRTQEDIARRIKIKQQRVADRNNVVKAVNYLAKWCRISGEPHATFTHLFELVLPNSSMLQLLNEWRKVISLIEADSISLSSITIKPDLVRSWEYYTGIVFELHSGDLHLGGGGRYDELARLVGANSEIPSVGFAYYGNRILDALQEDNAEQEPTLTAMCDEDRVIDATIWANNIRQYGLSVQIIPSSTRNISTKTEITVKDENTVQFQNKEYHFEQIDLLINDLKNNK